MVKQITKMADSPVAAGPTTAPHWKPEKVSPPVNHLKTVSHIPARFTLLIPATLNAAILPTAPRNPTKIH